MEIVNCLEESGLLVKDVSETIKNEANKQKGGFHSMLLCLLVTSLLGNLLTLRPRTTPFGGSQSTFVLAIFWPLHDGFREKDQIH